MADTPHTQTAYPELIANTPQSKSALDSFAVRPPNTSFNFQLDQEEILLMLRQHPITQNKWILVAILMVALPILFLSTSLANTLPSQFVIIAVMSWFLLISGLLFEAFLDWFYNVDMLTSERIVQIEFTSLLFKNISTARLEKIEDVTVTSSGYEGALFDFGNVKVQTAGATDEFEFDNVPHTNKVSTFINEMLEEQENK